MRSRTPISRDWLLLMVVLGALIGLLGAGVLVGVHLMNELVDYLVGD
jgi:hypothetical protein